MAADAAAGTQTPVSAQVVGNAFVQQYYHILHHSPGLVHRFYQDTSKLGRPEAEGSLSVTTTMQAINEKIVSLNYGDFKAEIKSVDAQESFGGGFQVLVTGYMIGKDNTVRNFAQTFFLAPQERGYFVLNDMFRFVDNANVIPAVVNDVEVPIRAEPVPSSIQENHTSEHSTPSVDESIAEDVYDPPENGDVSVVEDEIPLSEVVDQAKDDSQIVVESSVKSEEVIKKSYASIVMDLKESAATFSPPPSAPRKAPPVNVEQQTPTFTPVNDVPVSNEESATDNENNQEGEADGYSVYIKGLPMNATEAVLEEIFKKFGTIKIDGIQVRSNRQQGFCFGFVEFEEASSVQKALEVCLFCIDEH
ncbi:nuclear transport factor 2-like, partial [Primulina eburnea]|uniref:nuclear transport factor 2-like n=1 Tax=Primulina eburnea TaxID=1245227 RepID=UPI003C6BEEBF